MSSLHTAAESLSENESKVAANSALKQLTPKDEVISVIKCKIYNQYRYVHCTCKNIFTADSGNTTN